MTDRFVILGELPEKQLFLLGTVKGTLGTITTVSVLRLQHDAPKLWESMFASDWRVLKVPDHLWEVLLPMEPTVSFQQAANLFTSPECWRVILKTIEVEGYRVKCGCAAEQRTWCISDHVVKVLTTGLEENGVRENG